MDPTDTQLIDRYLIQNLQNRGKLHFHSSPLVPGDLQQFCVVLIQLHHELDLQGNCGHSQELCVYLENKNSRAEGSVRILN